MIAMGQGHACKQNNCSASPKSDNHGIRATNVFFMQWGKNDNVQENIIIGIFQCFCFNLRSKPT